MKHLVAGLQVAIVFFLVGIVALLINAIAGPAGFWLVVLSVFVAVAAAVIDWLTDRF